MKPEALLKMMLEIDEPQLRELLEALRTHHRETYDYIVEWVEDNYI